jgi:starch-binding outer membrane protein SusE/F
MIDMKNVIKLLLGSFLITGLLISCKKEENKVFFEGGTAPVLTASSTADLVLTRANAEKSAVIFYWTNPDYKFNTGVSSQDVTYTLQIDTTGSNFLNPNIQELAISNDLKRDILVKDLNGYLTKLNLDNDVKYSIEFRLKSSLVNGSALLFSNVIKMNITPYLDVALPIPNTGELYITGNAVASDWTNSPPVTQKFTTVSSTEFSITVDLVSGSDKAYKFLTTLGAWQPQYGRKKGTSGTWDTGDLGLNNNTPGYDSDPDGIPSPAVSGKYKITLNFKTGKYKAEKI